MRDVIDRLSLGFMGSARGRSRVTRAVVVIEQVAGAHDLACAWGQGGARVLAIDFDPQFALTRRFGVSPAGRPTFLARALRGVFDRYDVVLVDCPPNLGLLTVNALCAADQEPCVSGEAPTASNARRPLPRRCYRNPAPSRAPERMHLERVKGRSNVSTRP